MTATANIALSLASGTAGFLGMQAGPDFPLKDPASWGVGGIVAAIVWYMLRREEKIRAEAAASEEALRIAHAAEMQKQREAHAADIKVHVDATRDVAADFSATAKQLGESTAILLKQSSEQTQKLIETLGAKP